MICDFTVGASEAPNPLQFRKEEQVKQVSRTSLKFNEWDCDAGIRRSGKTGETVQEKLGRDLMNNDWTGR